jgi:hypothetical protein
MYGSLALWLVGLVVEVLLVRPASEAVESSPSHLMPWCFRLSDGPEFYAFFCDNPKDPAALDALLRGRLAPVPEQIFEEQFQVRYAPSPEEQYRDTVQRGLHHSTWWPLVEHNVDLAGWRIYDEGSQTAMIRVLVEGRYFLMATQRDAENDTELVIRLQKLDWNQPQTLARQIGRLF